MARKNLGDAFGGKITTLEETTRYLVRCPARGRHLGGADV